MEGNCMEERNDDEDEDDAFSDVNRPAGKLDFRIEDDAGRAERKRRERERRRDKERLRDWEEEVEEISRSVGLFGLVSPSRCLRLIARPPSLILPLYNRFRSSKACVCFNGRRPKIDWTRS
jgi:hypothetical protein